ncbi:TPA: hypothetical protein J7676_002714 [Escherichia coli]|nr:hypothetical protein [Escherichia coli]
MTKTVSTSKKPRKQHSPEFRSEALKLAERIGVRIKQPVPVAGASSLNFGDFGE